MSHQYLYLKLLLRDTLQLAPEDYTLLNTKQQGLVCSFKQMKLTSAFQPVFRADGRVLGREALLRVSLSEQGEQTPQSAFDAALEENRVVQFDRLVRVIHLMNYARSYAEHELLFLKVHPRLLASVGDHGRTFERILHFYSVPTSRVVIEIKDSADETVLADAVSNYRNLGYCIALESFGSDDSNLERAQKLKPDTVKLHSALIHAATQSHSAAESLKQRVTNLHHARIQVAITGIETKEQLEIARKSGADLLQGYQLARPEFAATAQGQHGRNEQLAA